MARRKRQTHHTDLAHALLLCAGFAVLVAAALMLARGGVEQSAAVVQSDVVTLTNTERVQNSVGILAESSMLDQAAQAKANDMAAKGYFSHTGPDGQPPWHWFIEAGYDYHYAGENLAVRFSDSREVVNAWMASPTHRANIVKSQYTDIGIGVADGTYQGQPATFVVQFFGAPQPGSELPAPAQPTTAAAKPVVQTVQPATAKPAVAGVETSTPVQPAVPGAPARDVSIFGRIANFFAFAWRSLTASAADAGGVVVGGGVSTER